jgi:acid phosphatase (class A)
VGYLAPGAAPDILKILPPPPIEGGALDAADMAIFRSTRRFEGTPRWALALRDNTLGTPALLTAFSCALDTTITAEEAPTLARLISQSNVDAGAASGHAKGVFGRKRPFEREAGAICLATPEAERLARASSDYPSGHATAAWMAGRVLAEVAPDRSAQILERARMFGESRVVCGVHHVTAVDAGRLTAEAVLAALHGVAAFRADVETARDEVSRLRSTAKGRPDACTADAATLALRPY